VAAEALAEASASARQATPGGWPAGRWHWLKWTPMGVALLYTNVS